MINEYIIFDQIMNNKFKINLDHDEVTDSDLNDFLAKKKNLSVLEEAFEHYLFENKLIDKFMFSGELEIELFFISDEEIKGINHQYRGKDKTTDVISISLFEDFRKQWIDNKLPLIHLGDVFISIDTAKRQAKESSLSFSQEIVELLIHGVLHLMGFDHEASDQEKELMYKKEREIFNYYCDHCD
jgi:probable rRNA maturation factor